MIIRTYRFSPLILASVFSLIIPGSISGQTPPKTDSQPSGVPGTRTDGPQKKNRRLDNEPPPQPANPAEPGLESQEKENKDSQPPQQDVELMYQQIRQSLDKTLLAFKAGPVQFSVVIQSPNSQDPWQGYEEAQVTQFFNTGKEELLEQLSGEQFAALRAYIRSYFPRPRLTSFTDPGYPRVLVTRSEVEMALNDVRRFIERLKNYFPDKSKLLVDLSVVSEPTEAEITMWPEGGREIKTTTNSMVFNVPRGLWKYTVIKTGHKKIEGTIDLVRESRTVLYCKLKTNEDKDGAQVCSFK